jgi:hypothetical protein
MKTSWQIWLQLFRRMPVLVVVANALWLAALVMSIMALSGNRGIMALCAPLFGMGTWFWHMGQGYSLRSLCAPESFLLPDFRHRLLEYAATDVVQWIVLPLFFAILLQVSHLPLVVSIMVLIAALGLMMGCNPRAAIFVWPAFILLGWMPSVLMEILKAAALSPFTPLLILAVSALIVRFSVTPLLRITDRDVDASPLESTSLGRMQTRGMPGEPRRTGAFGKRIAALYDAASQRAMTHALASYKQNPTLTRRMVLVRRLLLPHDNPEAIALRIALVAVIVCFYFFVAMHRQHFNAVIVGAYSIMLSMSRFPQLNVGMTRMLPNMADLYLTLAPETRSEYQKVVSDALTVLVPISMLTALVYTALGAVLVHAADPWRMLFVAAIVSASSSLAALAVHLIGPEGTTGRTIVNFAVLFGVMGVYWGGYWLVDNTGYLIGGCILTVVTLGFGFSAWYAAQREYLLRPPRFDAPIG